MPTSEARKAAIRIPIVANRRRGDYEEDESQPSDRPPERIRRGGGAECGDAGAVTALGQTRDQVAKGEGNHSASNPGPINKVLTGGSPDSYLPPSTDRGDVLLIWYSFDLVHRRIQDGGWTRQVTARELPSSQDVAGEAVRFLDAVSRPTEYPVGS